MSTNNMSDYAKNIFNSVRGQFEKDGTLAKLKSELHVKVIQMIRDNQMSSAHLLSGQTPGDGRFKEKRLELLNDLIMEYLNWFGFKHTMQTFAMETGTSYEGPKREFLETELGEFKKRNMPILMEVLLRLLAEKEQKRISENKTQKESDVDECDSDEEKRLCSKATSPYTSTTNITNYKYIEANYNGSSYLNPLQEIITAQEIQHNLIDMSTEDDSRNIAADEETEVEEYTLANLEEEIALLKSGRKLQTARPVRKRGNSSGSTDNDDLFSDIPEGHFYEEVEPPELKYPPDFGEEGPVENQKTESSSYFKNQDELSTLFIYKRQQKTVEGTQDQASERGSLLLKKKGSFSPRKIKAKFKSDNCSPKSSISLNIPATKTGSPITMISSVFLDSEDDD